MKIFLTIARWIVFLPGGLLAGIIASALIKFGACWFPEVIQDLACGAFGVVGTIVGGLYIAPVKHSAVKWSMILVCFLIGGLTLLGGIVNPDDRWKGLALGISSLGMTIAYCFVPTEELTRGT